MSEYHDIMGVMAASGDANASRSLQFIDGEIESWDPTTGTVTVNLQPGGQPTGNIPYLTPLAGKGWGIQVGPPRGMPVKVFATDAEKEHLYCMAAHYNDVFKSPGAKQGESWITHEKLSYVKLLNDERVVIGSKVSIDLSDTEDPLGDDDAIVRKADLQKVIDDVNALKAHVDSHKHISAWIGSPTSPSVAASGPAPTTAPAEASSIAKAKGG